MTLVCLRAEKAGLMAALKIRSNPSIAYQGGIKFKPELRVRNQDYGVMKVDHFVVEIM